MKNYYMKQNYLPGVVRVFACVGVEFGPTDDAAAGL